MFYSPETFHPTQKRLCVRLVCTSPYIVHIDPEELLLKFLFVLGGKTLDRGKESGNLHRFCDIRGNC